MTTSRSRWALIYAVVAAVIYLALTAINSITGLSLPAAFLAVLSGVLGFVANALPRR